MKAKEMLDKIKALGGRQTRARQALIKELAERGELVSAAELAAGLADGGIAADRTTVYRELAFLKGKGLVREVSLIGRPSLFEIAGDHHHHLVCLDCGTCRPVKLPADSCRQDEALAKREKFKITDHSFEFYGLCQKCR